MSEREDEARPGSHGHPLTVADLNAMADRTVREGLGPVWIAAEIGRFTAHGSGHWYFTLKDDGASVSAVMFRGRNRSVRFLPEEGLSVLAWATPSIYEPRGQFQVIVEALEPRGRGSLLMAFEQLRGRLAAEGLFEPARKRRLPRLPSAVGVVTSLTGAALRDVLRVLRRRAAGVRVLVSPAQVQGEGAAGELQEALRALDGLGLDAVLLVRGGGAYEDLAAFNDEGLARTLAAMATPVVTGIGHETDLTIADLAADLRAATPSAAAEQVAASREELSRQTGLLARRIAGAARARLARVRHALQSSRAALDRAPRRLEMSIQRQDEAHRRLLAALAGRLERRRGRLAALVARLSPSGQRRRVRVRQERLAASAGRLLRAQDARLESARRALASLGRRLEALSPLSVLGRGYALVTLEDFGGPVLRDASAVGAGDRLAVRLARGRLRARVEETGGDENAEAPDG